MMTGHFRPTLQLPTGVRLAKRWVSKKGCLMCLLPNLCDPLCLSVVRPAFSTTESPEEHREGSFDQRHGFDLFDVHLFASLLAAMKWLSVLHSSLIRFRRSAANLASESLRLCRRGARMQRKRRVCMRLIQTANVPI